MTTMIRPTWTAESDEQREALAAAVKAAREHDRAVRRAAETEAAMWEAIVKAREVDVPDTTLCDRTGQSRATLNRKFGRRSSPNS